MNSLYDSLQPTFTSNDMKLQNSTCNLIADNNLAPSTDVLTIIHRLFYSHRQMLKTFMTPRK